MNSALKNMIFRFPAIAIMMLLFQTAHAGTIGAGQVNYIAAAQADRGVTISFMSRSQTVKQFETQGLDTEAARDRVAAMSDAEVGTLAGKIEAAPAGGDGLVLLVPLVLLGFFIWYFVFRR